MRRIEVRQGKEIKRSGRDDNKRRGEESGEEFPLPSVNDFLSLTVRRGEDN